ncbi:hypothetical protein [Nocardioides pantholopis]|uniref:hypothetical protein n=1 Tax=Nocardioides pantholopis TaxID=2483798 RepID=UPI000FDA5DB6|nr:hypothetical protein [Nocardioides pantholopis]
MPARLPTTRRAALGGTLAGVTALALGTAGCDVDDLDPRSQPSTESPAAPDPPDAALVREVAGSVRETATLVHAAGPERSAALAGLLALHEAHLLLLETEGDQDAGETDAPSPSDPSAPSGRPAPAQRQVVAAEQALQGQLADAALRASSGELARVLAAMSAAVAQQLATLSGLRPAPAGEPG